MFELTKIRVVGMTWIIVVRTLKYTWAYILYWDFWKAIWNIYLFSVEYYN